MSVLRGQVSIQSIFLFHDNFWFTIKFFLEINRLNGHFFSLSDTKLNSGFAGQEIPSATCANARSHCRKKENWIWRSTEKPKSRIHSKLSTPTAVFLMVLIKEVSCDELCNQWFSQLIQTDEYCALWDLWGNVVSLTIAGNLASNKSY